MTRPIPSVCEYCNVRSPRLDTDTCLACGAPLPPPRVPAKPPRRTTKLPDYTEAKTPHEDLRKAGERADEAYTHLLYAYGLFWRITADAFVIALGGFSLGLLAGALGLGAWGLVAGASLGAAVGYAVKGYLLTVVSVPGGILAGVLLAAVPWLLGMPPQGVFFIVWAAALSAALAWSYKRPFALRRWPEKLRPFLGALGGLALAALGLALGAGFRAAVAAWLGG